MDGLIIRCRNATIPIWRGLGSSAAAVVGGLRPRMVLSRRQICRCCPDDELIQLSSNSKGHPTTHRRRQLGGAVVVE